MPLSITLDCTDEGAWDRYVVSHRESTNYHRYRWRRVVEKSFGHRCHYLTCTHDDGAIQGILPLVHMKSALFGNFLVSLPFFNYGGVLSSRKEAGDALLAEASLLQKRLGAVHTELRHTAPWPADLAAKQHKVCMVLELENDASTQWRGFNAKLRNQIRKAEKSGLSAAIGGKELLPAFYAVFARNMRDLGTPVYSRSFFAEVLAAFPGDTRVITVSLDQQPVAAGLITSFHETVEIPWASSNREYNPLCPNNLLYWTALQFAIGEGFRRFDFGRSTPGEGTYRFKEQWGAQPVQLNWQYVLADGRSLPELNPSNPKYRLAISAWKKMPLALTRALGPVIVKNLP